MMNTVKCDQCGFTFPSQEELFNHYAICSDYQLEKATKRKLRRSSGQQQPKRARHASVDNEATTTVDEEMHTCLGCSERVRLVDVNAFVETTQ